MSLCDMILIRSFATRNDIYAQLNPAIILRIRDWTYKSCMRSCLVLVSMVVIGRAMMWWPQQSVLLSFVRAETLYC